jgi:hypothetical protein
LSTSVPDGPAAHANGIATLDAASLGAAALELAARDADCAAGVVRHGLPPLWDRPAGFPTLVHMPPRRDRVVPARRGHEETRKLD